MSARDDDDAPDDEGLAAADGDEPQETDEADEADEPAPPAPEPPLRAILGALGVTAVTTATIAYAFSPARAGRPEMLGALALAYALMTALAVLRLRRRGELRAVLLPRAGDLSLGALAAVLLHAGAMAGRMALTPAGSPREAWLIHVYVQIGDPREIDVHLVGAGVFVVAALEEITWRGLVMAQLADAFGTTRAWLASSVLFAVAHLPTAFLLRAEPGLNPIVVAAALGCSFVWGYLFLRVRRLGIALVSHALFSWSLIEFPLWRPFLEGLGR